MTPEELANLARLRRALNGVNFRTDDLDATFEKVRASGAEIVQEPADQPWGTRDCAVRDPSGIWCASTSRPPCSEAGGAAKRRSRRG